MRSRTFTFLLCAVCLAATGFSAVGCGPEAGVTLPDPETLPPQDPTPIPEPAPDVDSE